MRIAVCDDDRPIREELIRLIQKQVSDADITEYRSGEELIHAGADFDIYFLDIDGFFVRHGAGKAHPGTGRKQR